MLAETLQYEKQYAEVEGQRIAGAVVARVCKLRKQESRFQSTENCSVRMLRERA